MHAGVDYYIKNRDLIKFAGAEVSDDDITPCLSRIPTGKYRSFVGTDRPRISSSKLRISGLPFYCIRDISASAIALASDRHATKV